MPNVSIILAVYNVEPYLRRSLDCLINQTLKNLEFICVDDCSTDSSLAILKEYEAKDSRFKIITSETNDGAAVARNKGLTVAEGEYLGFIDPDDEIDLNYYEELYKKAKEDNYDIVKCLCKKQLLSGKEQVSKLNERIKKEGLSKFTYEWTTAIYKTSIIKDNNINFPDEVRKGQDTVFLIRAILKSKSFAFIDNVFYYYIKRENSLDAAKLSIKNARSGIKACDLVFESINESDLINQNSDLYIKFYAEILNLSVRNFLYRSNDKECLQLLAELLIDNFVKCKKINEVRKLFDYKKILKYIDNKNVAGLIQYFNKYDNYQDFHMSNCNSFLQNIFSVKNDINKTHKIITIFGIKIKLKRIRKNVH